MLRGLTSVNFWAADMAAAKDGTRLLGFGPYFERPLGSNPHSMPSGASATTNTSWV